MRYFRPFFSNFDKCRPEAVDDVISGVAVNKVGMDVRVKFGDSAFETGPNYLARCRLVPFHALKRSIPYVAVHLIHQTAG